MYTICINIYNIYTCVKVLYGSLWTSMATEHPHWKIDVLIRMNDFRPAMLVYWKFKMLVNPNDGQIIQQKRLNLNEWQTNDVIVAMWRFVIWNWGWYISPNHTKLFGTQLNRNSSGWKHCILSATFDSVRMDALHLKVWIDVNSIGIL